MPNGRLVNLRLFEICVWVGHILSLDLLEVLATCLQPANSEHTPYTIPYMMSCMDVW